MDKGEPASLFQGNQFTDPGIDQLLREMINYRFRDALAPRYYDSYTHILLIRFLEQLSSFNPQAR